MSNLIFYQVIQTEIYFTCQDTIHFKNRAGSRGRSSEVY